MLLNKIYPHDFLFTTITLSSAKQNGHIWLNSARDLARGSSLGLPFNLLFSELCVEKGCISPEVREPISSWPQKVLPCCNSHKGSAWSSSAMKLSTLKPLAKTGAIRETIRFVQDSPTLYLLPLALLRVFGTGWLIIMITLVLYVLSHLCFHSKEIYLLGETELLTKLYSWQQLRWSLSCAVFLFEIHFVVQISTNNFIFKNQPTKCTVSW